MNKQQIDGWPDAVSTSKLSFHSHSSGRRRPFVTSPMSVIPSDNLSEHTSSSSSSCSSYGAFSEDADEGDEPLSEVERLLPSGDLYRGQWRRGAPQGVGKYLWTDGCMYEGEWSSGKTTGRGRFSWPSGATYEGDFELGFMHGYGTYTGSTGDTYSGQWADNLKHGRGRKRYANGDSYDGRWRADFPDGAGRFRWRNGTEYAGQWCSGRLHGRGTLKWANGNRYDGGWRDGLPHGDGTFRWADGSLYVGVWDNNPAQLKGNFYPSPSAAATFPPNSIRDPREAFATAMDDCKIKFSSKSLSIMPSQKVLHWPSEIEKEDDHNPAMNMTPEERFPYIRLTPARTMRKQGRIISKGHKNYDLMINLQLGIRHTIGKQQITLSTSFDLKASSFDPREKVWTKFPPEGSKHTPPHQSCDFKWKDYCPAVFRALRKLFKVDSGDYMISICGDNALRELSSPGKSGSLFFLTHDDKYMIKTMRKAEAKVLLRMLPAYYNHVRAFENTLVTKFFGLHCVKSIGTTQKKIRFVIFGNLFCSEYPIHRRFDLKGSSHGRTTQKSDSEIDEYTTLKDLDLNFIFRLQRSWFHEFYRQLDRDCEFLEQERIMDYSLLVGLSFIDVSLPRDSQEDDAEVSSTVIVYPRSSRESADQFLCDSTRWSTIRLGLNMPARVETTRRRSPTQLLRDPTGEFYNVVLFFGIIDILQDYDISKKLEHAYKSIQYDPTSISAVDPRQYSKRFRDFIFSSFTEDT